MKLRPVKMKMLNYQVALDRTDLKRMHLDNPCTSVIKRNVYELQNAAGDKISINAGEKNLSAKFYSKKDDGYADVGSYVVSCRTPFELNEKLAKLIEFFIK